MESRDRPWFLRITQVRFLPDGRFGSFAAPVAGAHLPRLAASYFLIETTPVHSPFVG